MPAFKKVAKRGVLKLNDSLIEQVANAMRGGAYIETAAAYAGIDKDTLFVWFRKGREKPSSVFGKLISAVDKAQADCEMRDLMAIEMAINPKQIALPMRNPEGKQLHDKDGVPKWIYPMKPDWSAAAWRLERRNAKRWSKTEKVETTGKDGGPVETVQVVVSVPDNGRDKPDGDAKD